MCDRFWCEYILNSNVRNHSIKYFLNNLSQILLCHSVKNISKLNILNFKHSRFIADSDLLLFFISQDWICKSNSSWSQLINIYSAVTHVLFHILLLINILSHSVRKVWNHYESCHSLKHNVFETESSHSLCTCSFMILVFQFSTAYREQSQLHLFWFSYTETYTLKFFTLNTWYFKMFSRLSSFMLLSKSHCSSSRFIL